MREHLVGEQVVLVALVAAVVFAVSADRHVALGAVELERFVVLLTPDHSTSLELPPAPTNSHQLPPAPTSSHPQCRYSGQADTVRARYSGQAG